MYIYVYIHVTQYAVGKSKHFTTDKEHSTKIDTHLFLIRRIVQANGVIVKLTISSTTHNFLGWPATTPEA